MAAIAAAGIGLFGSIISSRGNKSGGTSSFTPGSINAGGFTSAFNPDTRSVSVSTASKNSAQIADIDRQIAALTAQISRSGGLAARREERGGQIRPALDPAAAAQLASLNAQRQKLVAGDGPGARQGLVDQTSGLFGLQAQEIAGLRGDVEPGFGRLSQSQNEVFGAARERFGNQRTAAIGNLRENLSRRRVLGSSFADDAQGRLASEFALQDRELTAQESETKARTFLQELDLKTNLINQQFDLSRKSFETQLNELNLQADIALQLSTGVTSQLGANARLESELMAQSARGAGQFFGQISQPIADSISNFVSTRIDAPGTGPSGGGGGSILTAPGRP